MIWLVKLAYWAIRCYWWLVRPITLGVRLILIQDGAVMLVQHTYHPGWQFPGGGVKRGETLAQAAEREAWEEVGAKLTQPPVLLGLYTNLAEGKTDHVAVFYAEQFIVMQPSDRWEIKQRRAFALEELPTGLSASYRQRLREYAEGKGPYTGQW
jgi:8-oxo-dGTP pyrophosphatase MutT (NUDIX family)